MSDQRARFLDIVDCLDGAVVVIRVRGSIWHSGWVNSADTRMQLGSRMRKLLYVMRSRSFGSTGSDHDREQKAKTVNRLAKRLMMARLKLMKARIAAAREVQSLAAPDKRAKKIASYNDRLVWDAKREVALDKKAKEIASLERKFAMTLEAGLDAILREFGAQDDPVLRVGSHAETRRPSRRGPRPLTTSFVNHIRIGGWRIRPLTGHCLQSRGLGNPFIAIWTRFPSRSPAATPPAWASSAGE